jgi:small subunit ribosomal protein S19
MPRSLWKGPFIDSSLIKLFKLNTMHNLKLEDSLKKRPLIINTWSRRSTIIPEFVNSLFNVYNGHKFIKVKINENMIGHKLGEFASTRKIGSLKFRSASTKRKSSIDRSSSTKKILTNKKSTTSVLKKKKK